MSIYKPKLAKSNQETFRMNVSLVDFPKKSYLRKTVLFRKFKSLRSHKTKTKS